MAHKIAFFGAKPYDTTSFDKISEWYEFDTRYYKRYLNINNIVLTQGVGAVCISVNGTADAAVINALAANGVKLLALRYAGFNNVDLNAARGKLPVVRVSAYSSYVAVEYTLALMLLLNRKTHRAHWRTRDGNFSLNGLMGFDMHSKTAGIIGTGKVTKISVHILKGLGMHVLANDLYPDEKFVKEEGITCVSLDELYKGFDIIPLHCPLTNQTRYLISDDSIAKTKDGVMIINMGHGSLIHTNALIEGLKTRRVSAVELSVYEEEGDYFYEDKPDKIIDDDVLARLLSFNNVVIIPHQVFFTKEAPHNIADTILRNIKDSEEGRSLVSEATRQILKGGHHLSLIYYIFVAITWWEPSNGFFDSEVYIWK